MSYGLVFGAIAAVVLFFGFIGGLVWWVRRPIRAHREGPRVLPLFGHDQAAIYGRADDEEDEEDDKALLIEARTALANASAEHEVAREGAHEGAREGARDGARHGGREGRFAPPSWSAPRYRPNGAPTNGDFAPPSPATPPPTPPPAPSQTSNGAFASPRTSSTWTAASATNAQPATQFDGRSIRFSVPTDSTLQFLPGKLDIVGGHDRGREIRFVRTPGPDGIEVTFGRKEGPPYRHVQLHDATVSRSHARMALRDGHWHLANLSTTNPVLLNGNVVATDAEQALADGDRIEMGEVVFRFRA